MFVDLLMRKIKYIASGGKRIKKTDADSPRAENFEAAEEADSSQRIINSITTGASDPDKESGDHPELAVPLHAKENPGEKDGTKTDCEAVREQEQYEGSRNKQCSKGIHALSENLKQRILDFKKNLGCADDIKVREFRFGQCKQFSGAVVYIDGLADHQLIIDSILRPLIINHDLPEEEGAEALTQYIKISALLSDDTEESSDPSVLATACLNGNTVLFIDGCDNCLIIGTKGWDFRNISEPQTEPVVKGPREGFTENFRTNTSLLRRKIKSPALRMENLKIGRKTGTDLAIIYLENVAKPELVATVRERLKNVEVDSILETGNLEEYIEDNPFSIFTTIGYTEKPDVAAAQILEGRVAVVIDGTPFVMTMPMFFIESFQTAEDYYNRPYFASLTRMLRLISYIIAIFTLPVFIALTTFHQEFLPSTLLFTIANAREGTPFPVVLEGLLLIIAFEILREAGLRLPRPVGQAISIVGALVMGEAAVAAGLVGSPIVICVAISAVAGYTVPMQTDTISITRLIMMGLAAILGGLGISLGFLALLIHLAKLKSFGVPFFASSNPDMNLQDSFIRVPLWQMEYRPNMLAGNDKKRKIKKIPPIPEAADAQKN
jgi:spore germination protein KA